MIIFIYSNSKKSVYIGWFIRITFLRNQMFHFTLVQRWKILLIYFGISLGVTGSLSFTMQLNPYLTMRNMIGYEFMLKRHCLIG